MQDTNKMNKDQYIRSLTIPDECAICYEAWDGNHVAVRLGCGHFFGTQCIINSIEHAPSPHTCPSCRDCMYRPDEATGSFGQRSRPAREPHAIITATGTIRFAGNDTQDLFRQWKERWESLEQLSEGNRICTVQRIWDIVRSFDCIDVSRLADNLSHSGYFYFVGGILQRIGLSLEDPSTPLAPYALERYAGFVASHPYAYLYSENIFLREPLRFMVEEMLVWLSLGPADTLPPETALLWWKYNLLTTPKGHDHPTVVTEEEETLALHFMLVCENLAFVKLGARTDEARSSREPTSYFWYKVKYQLGLYPSTAVTIAVRREVEMMQPASNEPGRPFFIGAPGEAAHLPPLLSVWRSERGPQPSWATGVRAS